MFNINLSGDAPNNRFIVYVVLGFSVIAIAINYYIFLRHPENTDSITTGDITVDNRSAVAVGTGATAHTTNNSFSRGRIISTSTPSLVQKFRGGEHLYSYHLVLNDFSAMDEVVPTNPDIKILDYYFTPEIIGPVGTPAGMLNVTEGELFMATDRELIGNTTFEIQAIEDR